MKEHRSLRDEILASAEVRTHDAHGLNHRVLTFRGGGEANLVFVPGITSPAETVEFIAAALPEFTVHVPDLRGRGRSGRAGPGSYTLEHYRRDLEALLVEVGLEDPVIVGHSLGARIAGSWAAVTHRQGVRVILVDPPLSGPGRHYPMSAESFADQLAQARRGTTADEIRSYFPGWPERELRLRAEVLSDCDATAVAKTHRGFEEEDFFAIWDRLPDGVSLMYGQDSPVVLATDVEQLTKRNPRVPVVAVPGAGHMVPWDNLEGFTHTLRQLISAPANALTAREAIHHDEPAVR